MAFLSSSKCNAQELISTKQLDGTQWKVVSRTIKDKKEVPNETHTIKFSMSVLSDSIIFPNRKVMGFQKQYYISDVEPTDIFEQANVGVNRKGKYIILYNDKTKEVEYYTVISASDEELVLFHKANKNAIPNLDALITYKKILIIIT